MSRNMVSEGGPTGSPLEPEALTLTAPRLNLLGQVSSQHLLRPWH